jgi:hypothetical protein
MKVYKYLILLILVVFINTTSCHKYIVRHKQSKALREADRKQRAIDKEKERKYEEAVKRNASHQSKKTKKMMKSTYKRADMYNHKKKPFFLKRWFSKRVEPIKSDPKQE